MRRIAIIFAVVASVSLFAAQGTRPKPAPKPAPKPSQTAPTKGTVQLPGDNGKIGTTYQMGRKGDELHFTLDAVEIGMRAPTVEDQITAKKGQRIAILKFTVQNPQNAERRLDWSTFKFTMISPDDENFQSNSYLYHPDRHTRYDVNLKPAQKVKAYVAFPIYAVGPVTKLMVQRHTDAPVLRYDLREKAKFLPSAFFSPTGDALEKAPWEPGKLADAGPLDVIVEKYTVEEGPVGNYKPSATEDLITVTVQFTNAMRSDRVVTWHNYRPTMLDENGENIQWRSDLVTMSSGTTMNATLEPGATVKGRYVFTCPKGMKPKTFNLNISESERTLRVIFP